MITKYQAVLFDMDGVVVDTMPYHFQAWQKVFKSLDIDLDRFEIYKREGEKGLVSLKEILEIHKKYLTQNELQKLLLEKERIFKEIALPKLMSGINDLINALKKHGTLIGLVSGTSKDEIEHLLPAYFLRLFNVIVAGDEVKYGKPDPEPYLKAINILNIDSDRVIIIENAPYGIESAKKAGAFCIAITSSLPREYIKGADIICNSLKEAKELIFGTGL